MIWQNFSARILNLLIILKRIFSLDRCDIFEKFDLSTEVPKLLIKSLFLPFPAFVTLVIAKMLLMRMDVHKHLIFVVLLILVARFLPIVFASMVFGNSIIPRFPTTQRDALFGNLMGRMAVTRSNIWDSQQSRNALRFSEKI